MVCGSVAKAAMVISTYPDKKSASKAARGAVKSGLAACVNISRISSVYSWKGKIEEGSEYLAIFKTTQGRKARLKQEIGSSHPYDLPEIAEIGMGEVDRQYMRWIEESTA
ncbi:uncharacterized protein involved in tolerance to divalent cations [Cenarchaeum symbiosum A]|uniref:Uncharacterized protein involved in tolerance to divalent cations n=1 Tax=Cenarchaeum symbiosum (strain A) TaxID=414004 RepID=A0RWD0_CENSY|nr:uncharacterized protein involved in tolerance to divalent cations [Cenarchaeum symbiosum A]